MGICALLALECDFHGFGRWFDHGALYQPLRLLLVPPI
jgi:hypothetical protein